ncbi:hypothetical protein FACS1894158_00300 [Betaproteobacteria bacterium]|nr:hypothetical protein FACS1894158_00300 [Betaproteobacteria bacterium]
MLKAVESARRLAQAISPERLQARILTLARFGAREDGGVDRQALSASELEARHWLAAGFARRPGYRILQDDAANLFIRRAGYGAGDPVLTGSHIDTQPTGGKLDGAFGVCAALEVMEAMDTLGMRTRFPLETVIWNNEEGVRFSPGLMGSSAFVSPECLPALNAVTDREGIAFGDACEAARENLRQWATRENWPLEHASLGRGLRAYLEAHIEQGPILEERGLSVACVEAIQAVRWRRVVLHGRSAHAGTTPRMARDDAMAKAIVLARQIMALEEEFDDPDLRVTIGRWQAHPDAINTVADHVGFTLDLRHPDMARLADFEMRIAACLPIGADIEALLDKPTAYFDPALRQLALNACQHMNVAHTSLFSGAFHDALNLARHCPSVMLFAPSHRGISHHPEETTPIDDLADCARILAFCLAKLTLFTPAFHSQKGITMSTPMTSDCHDNGEPDGVNASLSSPISADGIAQPGKLYTVPARQGRAVRLTKNDVIRVINTHGTQVCDTWAFNTSDMTEFMSMEHVRAWIDRIIPIPGDALVSNRRRPILTLIADTSPGVHDTLIAPCDLDRYRTLGVAGYHDNCADNLRMALKAIGLRCGEVPCALNLWMNIPVEGNAIQWLPTVAKPMDYVELRAEMDCVLVMSACPQDIVPINDQHPKDVQFIVNPDA